MASNLTDRARDEADRDTLDRLCSRVEAAWHERRDPTEVDRVARENPSLAAELYHFFSTLMEIELDTDGEGEGHGPDEQVRTWLEKEGYELALRAAREECQETTTSGTSPAAPGGVIPEGPRPAAQQQSAVCKVVPIRSFSRLLQERAGATPVESSKRTDTPLEFIMFAQQNQEPRYDRLRGEIVRRGVEAFGIDYEEGDRAIRQKLQEAAFAGTTTTRAASFKELVARSRLTQAKKKFWLSLVEDESA